MRDLLVRERWAEVYSPFQPVRGRGRLDRAARKGGLPCVTDFSRL